MPNLVGIGNSQVPTNAMLGGMAYQESNNVVIDSLEPGNLSKIITSLNAEGNSPRGVFVYNTANDSDGEHGDIDAKINHGKMNHLVPSIEDQEENFPH